MTKRNVFVWHIFFYHFPESLDGSALCTPNQTICTENDKLMGIQRWERKTGLGSFLVGIYKINHISTNCPLSHTVPDALSTLHTPLSLSDCLSRSMRAGDLQLQSVFGVKCTCVRAKGVELKKKCMHVHVRVCPFWWQCN